LYETLASTFSDLPQVGTVRIEAFFNEKIDLTMVYGNEIDRDFFGLSAFGARILGGNRSFFHNPSARHPFNIPISLISVFSPFMLAEACAPAPP